jgi:CRISPR/Cas system-associated protein endoribonuclease Cas2
MTPGSRPWLRPFEFQLIQRMYLRFGIWSGEDLLSDLESWVRNDVRQNWWIPWFEHEHDIDLHRYLSMLAFDFLWSVSDVWDARRYAKEHDVKSMIEMQERLGPARLVWEHTGYGFEGGYWSVDHSNPRLKGIFNFRFTGQRAGSEWHRDIVTEYANILQSKGRFVTVDSGAVESKLPDISIWKPHTPLDWWPGGAIEVEAEAYRKSDEAILRNLEKHRENDVNVRFVVMSEKSFERIYNLIEEKTGEIAMRVENYLGYLNNPIQIEVIDPPSGSPYYEFLKADKVPGYDRAAKRSSTQYPRIMTSRDEAKEKRDREEAEMPQKLQRAWELAERGDDTMLTGLRREAYQRKVAEEDER